MRKQRDPNWRWLRALKCKVLSIKKGKGSYNRSPTRGWAMSKILKQFDDPLDQKYAREYIINDVCSIQ